jgi:hypothetical protein
MKCEAVYLRWEGLLLLRPEYQVWAAELKKDHRIVEIDDRRSAAT